jgi:hypothetical protein
MWAIVPPSRERIAGTTKKLMWLLVFLEAGYQFDRSKLLLVLKHYLFFEACVHSNADEYIDLNERITIWMEVIV